ncbi:MAG TPA: lysylphosphatidylglycerol synthase transmembrane domain-containing protein [Candidatus Saccharimonadales bacterium]|nr:lysylphosphatidylglycerol synthase transmembrane domain-containing protein [Candidatus Saccharimonadales bacterium]
MRYLRWILIAAIIALAVYHLKPHFADFEQFPHILKSANYFFLFLSALGIFGQYIGDGWLSKALLEITGHKISLRTTIKIASIDVFAAHLLPIGEAGVVATSAYFYKKLGVSNQGVIFLTLAWGIATNIVLFIFLLTSFAFLPKLPNVPIHISNIAKILILIILALLLVIVVFRKLIFKLLDKKLAKYAFFGEIKKFISKFASHKQKLAQNKKLAAEAMLAALVYYIANIASLYLCFLAFHAHPNIAVVTAAYLISLIVATVTLTPAGIGTAEATMILVFLQFGQNPALTTAAVLAFRLFAFWLPIPAGAMAYMSLKSAKVENQG